MIQTLESIDQQIFLWLNSLHTDCFDQGVFTFSHRFVWIPLYVAIAASLIWHFGWKRGLLLILAIGAAVGLSDFICSSIIRPLVERVRPANAESSIASMVHVVNDYRGGHYGFPSCHAANSFALAMATSIIIRRRAFTIAIFAWAALQCLSRIYLGVHFPGDLIVGAAIGSLIGWAACASVRRISGNGIDNPRQLLPIWFTGLLVVLYIIIIGIVS